MDYEEASKIYGDLIVPSMAARLIGIKQPNINELWERKILTKIKVSFGDTEKNMCSKIEVYQYLEKKKKREQEKAEKKEN